LFVHEINGPKTILCPYRAFLASEKCFHSRRTRLNNTRMADPTPPSAKEWLNKTCRWLALHPNWTLLLVVLAALAPFLAKPFNIDDPLFLWTARQIQAHPADPYGFKVNWYGTSEPMWWVTENPPLASYYLALAAGVLGWSEVALHFAFLLPAVAAILGTHRLARRLCQSPMLAALATLFTPVFLVSGTTVMCDVMMLAFWVWAAAFWLEGLEENRSGKLFAAGGLIALAALTKYFGACLIPLLVAHGVMGKRRFRQWAAPLLIPLAALCAYQWITRALYGHALLSEATDYAKYAKGLFEISGVNSGLIALAFTGGCLAVTVVFAPLLWRRRMPALFAGAAVLTIVALLASGMMPRHYDWFQGASRTLVELQVVFWAVGGISVLALAIADGFHRRDASSWLLVLWVFGTFSFTAFFNWTVNGRSLLPLAPAVGVLIVRRLEQDGLSNCKTFPRGAMFCLIASAMLAFGVAQSDFLLAVATRQSARLVCANYKSAAGNLWFQGHWGFQYYLDQAGAWALDAKHLRLKSGDTLALPMNNEAFPLNLKDLVLQGTFSGSGPRWFSTWNTPIGAGFYASSWGPLPFAVGRTRPEIVSVYVLEPAAPAPTKN
jgi:4-amino-4-deoxy-L-arabinose transferase-like glycosyltransferase